MLAYSGGLDTSVALRWLAEEYGAEVVALLVDVGQGVDRETVTRRALAAGAADVVIADAREEFAREFVLPILQAGALYEGRYPLVSALSRPLIARHLVAVAREARRHGRRPRLHRQGQRPGAVRDRRRGARAGSRRPRPGPRLGHDARAGDRLRRAARHRGAREARRRVLDRPEPVGAVDRGRPARGSVGRAARGGLRAHARAGAGVPRAAGGRDHVRGRRARWPSTARSWASSS